MKGKLAFTSERGRFGAMLRDEIVIVKRLRERLKQGLSVLV